MTARLKLSIVTPAHVQAFMGGAQYQVQCLLDELVPLDRFDIQYVARRAPSGLKPRGYDVVKLGQSLEPPRWGYWVDALPLYRALQAFRPDVIYQRVACAYTGVAACYARRHGARMIWHVAHDADVQPGGRRGGRGSPVRWLERQLVEYGLRHATHIVTQTGDQARMLQLNYGRVADAVVPNFHPLPAGVSSKTGPLTVVWIANLKPWKQPDAFVRLARRLADLGDARFVMVGAAPKGGTDEAWGAEVIEAARATPNLSYVGQLSQEQVNELLEQAHVFVNTSRSEGFANTFIQAWMRRVPVVSLHVNPDGIFDREDVGSFAGDEATLASAVRLLLTDATRRDAQASHAREYAIGRHSTRNVAKLIALMEGSSKAGQRHAAGEAPVADGLRGP